MIKEQFSQSWQHFWILFMCGMIEFYTVAYLYQESNESNLLRNMEKKKLK